MKKISFKQFRDKTINTIIKVPWGFAGECVSLVQIGLNEMYGVPLQRRGNAKDYGYNIINNKYGYQVDKPRYGDIVVWGNQTGGGYGHIAFYVDSKTIYDQNNANVRPTKQAKLRPMLKLKPIQYIRMYEPLLPDTKSYDLKPKGAFRFENDVPIKIRDGEKGLKGADTGVRYNKGQTLMSYDKVYEADGYVWLSYIAVSGKRRSVAVGKDGKLWGRNV